MTLNYGVTICGDYGGQNASGVSLTTDAKALLRRLARWYKDPELTLMLNDLLLPLLEASRSKKLAKPLVKLVFEFSFTTDLNHYKVTYLCITQRV